MDNAARGLSALARTRVFYNARQFAKVVLSIEEAGDR
jgi:hypothetical protein